MPEEKLQKVPRRSALLVAFHFPPLRGSSGIQRTLGFSRHLPSNGWAPVVLTANSRAYESVDEKQLDLIPDGLAVERAFCLDAARHLAIAGRYPDRLAIPDRWASWIPGAVLKGMGTIKRLAPSVIWSTYPIASSHIIGDILARRSGLPWVADFRDPMVEWVAEEDSFIPADPMLLKARLKVEQRCVDSASALVFCTPMARDICLNRYPTLEPERCHVISNGYEEWSFLEAEKLVVRKATKSDSGALRILHSGTIYPTPDRDPSPFFDAIKSLKDKGDISAATLNIVLRASGHDDFLSGLLSSRGITDIVSLAPPLPYLDALAEMMTVDGLVIFQGHTSNPAIPAKLYEYLRAQTPILAMLDAEGSTANLMSEIGAGVIAPILDAGEIGKTLVSYLAAIRSGDGRATYAHNTSVYSRSELTKRLAVLFDSLSPTAAHTG